MKGEAEALQRCSLFAGLSAGQIGALLEEWQPVRRRYARGETLLLAGYETHELGIVLEGEIEAGKHTADGTPLTLTRMGPGGLFADILAGSRDAKSPVTVTAATPATALLLPYRRLLRPGAALDAVHAAVLQNLIAAIAGKYFALDRRVELLMLRSVREKILHYLHTEAERLPNGTLCTPYTRAGLAAYLGCERSALCRELSRMRRDGLVQAEGRSFRLLTEGERAAPAQPAGRATIPAAAPARGQAGRPKQEERPQQTRQCGAGRFGPGEKIAERQAGDGM